MCVDESSAKSKTKGAKSWPICISNTINKILDILTDNLPKHLTFFYNVDHKIEVVFGSALLSKSHYQLNKNKLQEFKVQINDLTEWGYIRLNGLPCGLFVFVDKKDGKLRMYINYSVVNKITIKNNLTIFLVV
jgi:hypothetical protein